MNDLPLWRQVRTGDPDTSRLAARRNAEGLIHQRDRVLAALREIGRGTIYDIAGVAHMTHVQVARRLAELGPDGTREAEVVGRGVSPSGDSCRLWRAA